MPGLVQNITDPVRTGYICRLMRVHDKGGRALFHRFSHQLRRRNHRGFQVQMRIDEAGCNVGSLQIHYLFGLVGTRDADNQSVLHRNRRFHDFAGKYVHQFSVGKKQIRLCLSQCRTPQFLVLLIFHDAPPLLSMSVPSKHWYPDTNQVSFLQESFSCFHLTIFLAVPPFHPPGNWSLPTCFD